MVVKNDKIYISQRNMDRLYHGTHKVWDILRMEGVTLVAEVGKDEITGKPIFARVPAGQYPRGRVVGIDLMEERQRFLTDWSRKFLTTNPVAGDKLRVKECRVNGLPPLVVETPEMKEHRCGTR